jgi:hypothetical protein
VLLLASSRLECASGVMLLLDMLEEVNRRRLVARPGGSLFGRAAALACVLIEVVLGKRGHLSLVGLVSRHP